ncbi:MAG: ABC transporter substrate-binding protein [Candidatus Binatia bacterium]
MSRRIGFILALVFMSFFCWEHLSAQTLRVATVGITGPNIGLVPLETAVRKGLFKRQGLDARVITVRQSDVIIKATMAGELHFMDIVPTAILASMRGLPIRTIAITVKQAPYVLIGQPQIKSIADLKGKKIGVSSLGGMSTYLVRDLVIQAGLNPDRDVTFLSVGGTSSRSAALASGTIDSALVVAPDNFALERKGYKRLVWSPDVIDYPFSGAAVSADLLTRERDFAAAFLRALNAGAQEVKQNRSESVSFIKSYLRIGDEEAERSYEFLIKDIPNNLVPDDSVIRAAMNFAAKSLKLQPEAIPDISKVRDWSFAPR